MATGRTEHLVFGVGATMNHESSWLMVKIARLVQYRNDNLNTAATLVMHLMHIGALATRDELSTMGISGRRSLVFRRCIHRYEQRICLGTRHVGQGYI